MATTDAVKVRLEFYKANAADNYSKYTNHTVSSQWELFQALFKMRRLRDLKEVTLFDKDGYYSLSLSKAYRSYYPGNVNFSQDDLTDPDRLDELAGKLWQEVLRQVEADPEYNRAGSKQPPELAAAAAKRRLRSIYEAKRQA